ncbi:MAG: VWA domain-containing protein [Phycisphaerales bacterium]|nr:VWA domain-containing protein [Phycisphaerales bacterium]MCB9856949.1 VWA domain-containing protein [Phycisphaerales bacterium]MCB9861924.1 VWA domain-containing protein [Phycisphaerales bacterium]
MCQGDNAYTDGRQIVLPSLPDPMDPPLERMIIGYLDHEASHVVWSDFDEVAKFNRKFPGCEAMLNVVEDALIEKRAMQRWPGVRANLDALFKHVKRHVHNALRKASPFRRFCTAVYLKLSHHTDMLGLGKETVGYEDLLDQFPQVGTTAESAALSEKLLQRWLREQRRSQSKKPPQEPLTDTGEDQFTDSETDSGADAGQPSQPGQRDSKANGSGADDDGATLKDPPAGDEHSEAPSSDPADADQESSTDGRIESQSDAGSDGADEFDNACAGSVANSNANDDVSPAPASTPENSDDDDDGDLDAAEIAQLVDSDGDVSLVTEVVTDGIQRAIAKVDNDRHYRVLTTKHDRIEVVPRAATAEVESLLNRGVDEVRRLRRGLANALRSAEKRWWREEQPRGSLSPRTLHRLCVDRPSLDIFRTRAVVQGKSTAVSIVLDASGSMTPSKMSVARDAVRVLLQALSDLNIPAEAFTFTTGDLSGVLSAAGQSVSDTQKLKNRFTRISNLEIGLIKRFEDSVKTAIERLPSIRGTGLTPLGEAMEIGARRLIVRPETRKIQLVVTDGRPACEGSDIACLAHACDMAERITRAGIELIGVGAVDDSLQQIIKNTIVVNRIEDLPAQLCKLLGRTLKKGVQRVG